MIKNAFSRIKDFISQNKKEPWFRYVAIIVITVVIAAALGEWRDYKERKEAEAAGIVIEAEEEEEGFLEQMWDDSKAHFVVFGILTVLLLAVRHLKSARLQERGGYHEKKSRKD